ncbi:MAG TPA: ABC transporter substrate-binding protein [Chloroflexota bacterium]
MAIRGNAVVAYQKLNPRSNIPGVDSLERLAAVGLTVPDPSSTGRVTRLAETAASVDNGLWKLAPDGSMDLRWTIKNGAVWSDGTAITTDDLLFTAQVVRDRDQPIFSHVAYSSLGSVEAIDQRTISTHWTQPFINADQLFSSEIAMPFPRHVLEEAYRTDKEHFIDHPGWGPEFVGAGPYKVVDWQLSSFVTFTANDRYIMGRPKIDDITVKFIPDPNTLAANILAGEVQSVWGGRTDIEWAQEVADRWQEGHLETRFASMLQIYPQMIGSSPAVVSNSADFRRAMLYALDRRTMAEVLQPGQMALGDSFLAPTEPEWTYVESAIVKYEYDPRKALQLLDGAGYTKGGDGFLVDGSGQRLAFQIRTSQGDVTQEKAMFASADDWQHLGVDVERFLVPSQRANDAEFRATFPAFDLKRQAGTMEYARSYHTRGIALPENNFLVSGNNSRYRSPEMDVAVDKYFTTVPWDQRMEWGRKIVHILSDDVGWIGLYHLVGPELWPDRLLNLRQGRNENNRLEFMYEWELK